MNPIAFVLVLVITIESLTAALAQIASARLTGDDSYREAAIFSGWWFVYCMSLAAYTYFFLLSSDFHQYHARVKPASIFIEGFVFASALGISARRLGAPLKREMTILPAAPFVLLAVFDLAMGGRSRDAVLWLEACALGLYSLALLVLGLLPPAGEETRKTTRVLIPAFGLCVLLLYAKLLLLPSSWDEPYAALAFFCAWSALFAVSAFADLRSAQRPSAIDGEVVSRYGSMKGLSPREIELCDFIARGASNKEIAFALSIAEGTVKKHFTSIFQKCGVSSRLELFRELSSAHSTTKVPPAHPR